jgi:hypothetical protein
MLALLYPRRDIMAARWELERGDARAKASACEYLDNVLSGPLRRRLMPMLEELTEQERVTKGNVILRTRPRDVEETLLILINSDDEVVSAAAIDLVGRLELRSLVDDLDHVLAHRDVRDWHVFEAASWTLAGLRLQASKRRALWLEPLPSVEIASRLWAIPLFASVATDELFRIARTGRQVGSIAATRSRSRRAAVRPSCSTECTGPAATRATCSTRRRSASRRCSGAPPQTVRATGRRWRCS